MLTNHRLVNQSMRSKMKRGALLNKCYKTALTMLCVTPLAVDARLEKSPTEMWSMEKILTTKTTVSVIVVDGDINAACNAKSQKDGFGRYRTAVSGCAFWTIGADISTCTIMVGKKTNNDTFGHEFRHCLQGPFH